MKKIKVYIRPHVSVRRTEIGAISKLAKKIFLYSDVHRVLEIGFGTAPEDAVIHGILLNTRDLEGKILSKTGYKYKKQEDNSIELRVAEKYRLKILPFP